jgi:hypothetical protein
MFERRHRQPAALTPRTTMFDTTRPLYRCFYGTAEGRWVHIEFHLRQGAHLLVLPIDADQDGAPYLRGMFDDVYRDNCPLAANPDQADRDGDGVGDICDDCPDVAGTCSDGGNDAGTADGGFDSTPEGAPAGGARADAPTVDAASGGTTQGDSSTGGCGCGLAGTPQGTSIHAGFIAVTFLALRRRKRGKSARLRRDAHRFDGGPRRR